MLIIVLQLQKHSDSDTFNHSTHCKCALFTVDLRYKKQKNEQIRCLIRWT